MAEATPAPRNPPRRRSSDLRVEFQPGFVLHDYPWRETSLIAEVYTRDYGRIALAARGAKRPTSQFRGLLAPFAPLALSWSGRGEVKSLVRIEWMGGLAPLRGDGLLAAFYLNELLVRLMPRADAHPALFAAYVQTLQELAREGGAHAAALRSFELDLLRELGHAPALDRCVDGRPVQAQRWYRIDAQQGLIESHDSAQPDCFAGSSILALGRRDFSHPLAAGDSMRILRQLIGYHLNGQPLNTRRILQDLRRIESALP